MNLAELNKVATAMVTPGKGVLAAETVIPGEEYLRALELPSITMQPLGGGLVRSAASKAAMSFCHFAESWPASVEWFTVSYGSIAKVVLVLALVAAAVGIYFYSHYFQSQ